MSVQKSPDRKQILRIVNKFLAIGLITYALASGLLMTLPYQTANLGQTSRNIFFHVPMWFAMMVFMFASTIYSIRYLNKNDLHEDIRANMAAHVGILFGILGLATGIIWSRVTWAEALPDSDFAAWWPWDPKQTTVLICMIIYLGYFLLRASFEEATQRAKIAAVFNIFAAATILPLFYIIPKVMESLHPNTSGKEAAVGGSMSPEFRMVFWPAVLGFICLGIWILDLRIRLEKARHDVKEFDL